MTTTHAVASVNDFAASTMQAHTLVDSEGHQHRVLVVRMEDSFYGLGEICSHADVSLVDGTLWNDECEIECPKHGSLFSLVTGKPSTFPATKPVPVYSVVVVDGTVVVTLP